MVQSIYADCKEVVRTKTYDGYIVQTEIVNGEVTDGHDLEMKVAYTPSGDYIGDPRIAKMLCRDYGITPERSKPDHNSCSIGKSTNGKWYGWSHRAIFGYGIGSVVGKGSIIRSEEFPSGFRARTEEDAKRMAIAFAEAVS